jgi:serine/threonine-protein kinase PknK
MAEDDVLLRSGLVSLLEQSGFDVVGQAADAAELLKLVRDKTPELVLTDIRMPPTHTNEGLDAARTIRDELPDTAIMLLSAEIDVDAAMELLASGERTGFLLKSRITDVADFIDTLRRVAGGASVVDPALVQELVAARRRNDPLATLTAREHDVLALMAQGLSNLGIAHKIWVTEGPSKSTCAASCLNLTCPRPMTRTDACWRSSGSWMPPPTDQASTPRGSMTIGPTSRPLLTSPGFSDGNRW